MPVKRASAFLALVSLAAIAVCAAMLWDGYIQAPPGQDSEAEAALVRSLKLTDLSLWTEARYTRHPSQADLFTPFQTGPSAPEHFPSGSWVQPSTMPWFSPSFARTGNELNNPGGQ